MCHGMQVEKGGGTGIINMGSKAGIEPVPGQARMLQDSCLLPAAQHCSVLPWL